MNTTAVSSSMLVLGLALFTPGEGTAQSNPVYVQFAPGAVKGALLQAGRGRCATRGYPDHPSNIQFHGISRVHGVVEEGFLVLCMNPRFDNNEAAVRWEISRSMSVRV